ncbi:hypothetical protein KI688_004274 [Linnemannia hyalina]|uniref:Uncharacterized protein n=1 Tax=Linnemannia hyalina TaxID=64524 RepID=A0A9P7XM18_9FUNG|nr:hypothetical protein KI688_004274 [Linnemannia hyalina]
MKFTSFALCLVAAALVVVVEAAPGSVGSHFRARMIRDKALLQRRGDPNSTACEVAKQAGYDKMTALNNSIQNYPDDISLDKVRDFQHAIIAAYLLKTEDSYKEIRVTYMLATEALASAGEEGKPVSDAMDDMMAAVDKAASECKA